jgi:hypothetical protein
MLVKRTLRSSASVFVISGAAVAFTRGDTFYARLVLIIGLIFALPFLWLDWRDRRR